MTLATMHTSLLMDKTPAEIRLEIFRLALRSESGVVLTRAGFEHTAAKSPDGEKSITQPTIPSLFTVSTQVSKESRDAFFEVNVVRCPNTIYELETRNDLFGRLRHVELTGDVARHLTTPKHPSRESLRRIAAFPRINDITIAVDEIHNSTMVREAFAHLPDFRGLRCLGLGLFEADFAPKGQHVRKITLKDYFLTRILSDARKLARTQKADDVIAWHRRLAKVAPDRREDTGDDSELALNFAMCLKSYEMSKALILKSSTYSLSPMQCEELHAFADFFAIDNSELMWTNGCETGPHTKIEDLVAPTHNSELLEWATNLLAFSLWWLRGLE